MTLSDYVVGLDVSTSVIGIAIINYGEPNGSNIIALDHVELSKYDNLYDKATAFRTKMGQLYCAHVMNCSFKHIIIEDPLMRFQQGMSSAATIARLNQFNGMASYIVFDMFNIKPVHVSAARARKLANVVIDRKGGQHKKQVFEHMQKYDLSNVVWKTKKNGDIVDYAYDITDAYVVARAQVVAESRGEKIVVDKKSKPLNKRPKKG